MWVNISVWERFAVSFILTWTLITRGAVFFCVVATKAGVFMVALANLVAVVRGAVVSLLQAKSHQGCASRQGGNSGGWLCTQRYAVNLNLCSVWHTIARVRTTRTYFIKARGAKRILSSFKNRRGKNRRGAPVREEATLEPSFLLVQRDTLLVTQF